MKILEKENYSHVLFEELNEVYLFVLCGIIGKFDIMIKLTNEEITAYLDNSETLKKLILDIKSSPRAYEARAVKTPFACPKLY